MRSESGLIQKIIGKIRIKYVDYLTTAFEIIVSALTGFIVGAAILVALGYDPARIYGILIPMGLSNVNYLLSKATPIMLTGMAFAVPLLAGVFNIGGEGQLYVGALATLIVAYYTHNPVIALAAGVAAGATLGAAIAALKVYRGVNEVIAAIMVNWIFYFFILYLLVDRLYNPSIPHQSIPVPEDAWIGTIPTPFGEVRAIFFIAVAAALLLYYIIYYTNVGYLLRVSGLSPKSSKYAGFSPEKAIIYSMVLGGGMAGLGGALLMLGYVHSIDTTMSTVYGLGFMGIGVGLLGRNHPIGIIFSSMFFSMLIIGGEMVELHTGAPPELADVLIGVIVIALALPYAYRMLVTWFRNRGVLAR